MAISTTFLFWASLIGFLALTQGCTPLKDYKQPTLEYKMMNSDIVASGKVLNRMKDDSVVGGQAYTVLFQVHCIFKGAPLPQNITIHRAGIVPGWCISTNLTQGGLFLVYLSKRTDGVLEPEYTQDPGDPQYVEEVTIMCEATVSYPLGLTEETAENTCPEEYTYDDCVQKPVITTQAPMESPPPPPESGAPSPPPPPINDQQPGNPPEKDEGNAPYKPVVSEEDDNDDNKGMTLTFSLATLTCLVLSTFLL